MAAIWTFFNNKKSGHTITIHNRDSYEASSANTERVKNGDVYLT